MPDFHTLNVVDVFRTIRDAVVVTLQPTNNADFSFIQGQYLTFRREFDGAELRRSYSICSGVHENLLRVGIKKVDGGAFSTWANEQLAPGDSLESMKPMGNFHIPIKEYQQRHYLGFAGGSGITPVLSILKTILFAEPLSSFTLVYANRAVNTIMFREELEDLKNQHMGRLSIVHVLESSSEATDLFSGRVDTDKCAALFSEWINIKSVDSSFICGPEPMMLGIVKSLKTHGLTDDQIKFELFSSSQPGQIKRKATAMHLPGESDMCQVDVSLDGTTHRLMVNKNQTLLESLLEHAVDAPFACKAGVCSTCRCRVAQGEIEMAANHALEDYEVERGDVLACQTYPVSDHLVVEYDH
jgi:ring-1,2-phenylacetyl-CoA epoxidase subunit PaaE